MKSFLFVLSIAFLIYKSNATDGSDKVIVVDASTGQPCGDDGILQVDLHADVKLQAQIDVSIKADVQAIVWLNGLLNTPIAEGELCTLPNILAPLEVILEVTLKTGIKIRVNVHIKIRLTAGVHLARKRRCADCDKVLVVDVNSGKQCGDDGTLEVDLHADVQLRAQIDVSIKADVQAIVWLNGLLGTPLAEGELCTLPNILAPLDVIVEVTLKTGVKIRVTAHIKIRLTAGVHLLR